MSSKWPNMEDFLAEHRPPENLEILIPCTKSSCWYNTGRDRECTRKPDNITPNSYDCSHYSDVFILLKDTEQPTMTSIKILKSRKK